MVIVIGSRGGGKILGDDPMVILSKLICHCYGDVNGEEVDRCCKTTEIIQPAGRC